MYIAICDDSKEDAMRLSALLESHRVEIFSVPNELLQKIERTGKQYDLYLLDIYMGEDAEGIELAKRIRKADSCFKTVFVRCKAKVS